MKAFRSSSMRPSEKGFALIATLSLMILLVVIAVGLLSLSAISLRTGGGSSARTAARANARLALMIAIGDLQKHAGPDQRVTANAEMVVPSAASPTNLKWTGVWSTSQPVKTTRPMSATNPPDITK